MSKVIVRELASRFVTEITFTVGMELGTVLKDRILIKNNSINNHNDDDNNDDNNTYIYDNYDNYRF